MDKPAAIPLFSAAIANADFDLASAVGRVLQSHWYVLGKEVEGFEAEFARYVGVDHCVTLANGTDALELALRAVGVGPGDRVATVANAGFYGSTAAYAIGALPVYVDVDDRTLTMCPASLASVLAHKPAAVIVTHLYGQLASMGELAGLCADASVPLIEDCAQAHGARRDGRQAGAWGAAACYSFYPTKNLGALGDGGAVVTRDAAMAARVRTLRQYGWSGKYVVATPGGRNSRLDELQAAILRAKLPHLDRHNAQRRDIARRYNAAFAGLPLRCPHSVDEDHAAHLYVVRSDQRDALRAHLQSQGVATDVHYPVPDHLQPAYTAAPSLLPVTEAAAGRVLTLPCFPGLADADVARVIAAVQSFFADTGR